MEDSEKKKCIQHSQSMSKGIEDLKDIDNGNQTLHGATKENMTLTLIEIERMLEEWRLNVAICTIFGNE